MGEESWSAIKSLLDDWLARVKKEQWAHTETARRYSTLNYWLGIPAVIFSTAVGTAVFATLDEKVVRSDLRIILAVISVTAAILAGLQTFLRLDDRSSQHRLCAARFAAIRREIEQAKVLPPKAASSPSEFLDGLRQKIDLLTEESPQIPEMIAKHFRLPKSPLRKK